MSDQLSRALARKLVESAAVNGCPLYAQTYVEKRTPNGLLVPTLRACLRRLSIDGRRLKGWPTPQARDWKGPQGRFKKFGTLDLPAAASLMEMIDDSDDEAPGDDT